MLDEPIEYAERYFFTPTAIEMSSAIWPIRLGQTIAKPNYHVGPRTTSYYSLHFVLDGTGTFIQDNKLYPLRPNDLFCLFPHRPHEYFTSSQQPLKMAWIAFHGKKAVPILERVGIHAGSPHLAGSIRPEIRELLDRFFLLIRSHGEQASDLAKMSVLFGVFEALANMDGGSRERTAGHANEDWLKKGADYMEIHYAEGISVEKVASFVGVDRAYFSRKFHAVYGISPIVYLQNLKMKAARDMLEQTEESLTQIALSVGYPDLFSFSKAFKKNFAVSPSEFRRSIRLKEFEADGASKIAPDSEAALWKLRSFPK
ncbi:MAG: AraC family transcriptional regulator [Paenibacillus sp.]|nr:AraC family transcriptional regulator [Paenibacillus sp.]